MRLAVPIIPLARLLQAAAAAGLCLALSAHAAAPHHASAPPAEDAELPSRTGLECKGIEVTDSDPVKTAPATETLYLNMTSASWSEAGQPYVHKFVSLDANRITLEKSDRALRWLNRRTLAYWHAQPAADGDNDRVFVGRCTFIPWQPSLPLKL